MIEQARELAQRLRNAEVVLFSKDADTIDALVADNEAIRTLMDCYNVGGWTDSLALIKERDQLRAEVERLRDFVEEYIEAWDEGMAADGYLLRKAREALENKHD